MADDARPAWHALDRAEVLERLGAGEHGLTTADATGRLQTYGRNELPRREPPAFWLVFLRQFNSPLIFVLGIAAVVSAALGEHVDAAFILAVLLLNATIGGVQEWRAERASQALQRLLKTRATAVRDGEACELDAEELVPGDVVWLESGNRVPADVRLLSAQGLQIDESLLTGESLPVTKDADWRGPPAASLGDRLDMGHAGSVVARGRASAIVVATGGHTVIGELAREVGSTDAGEPPLLVRLKRFTRVIGLAVLGAALLVGALGVLLQGKSVSEMFLFAVALAVSAIPEGLPVALTVALSVAMRRMARRGVIVRRLAAVEGLGSCTLIASDKTGTLTCNELTVRRVQLPDGSSFDVTGEGYAPDGDVLGADGPILPGKSADLERLAAAATACNEAHLHRVDGHWAWHGDPTDVALLAFAHKLGRTREATLDTWPALAQIPFEPERKYAASFHRVDGATQVFVKGAPERVLDMCTGDEAQRDGAIAAAAELAQQGYRILAFAAGPSPVELRPGHLPPEPAGVTFLGFTCMIDPLRPGAREAVVACRKAGVDISMVTGDHPVTALAIARDLGLADARSEVVTGADLADTPEAERAGLVRRARVFARVSPAQKLEIVNAARDAGHFVAVTGDGVNDAPALRAANIGVAMGLSGTDVAREAAELVVSDDNFASIVAGVEEGRVAYDNIRKVIYLLISTGAAEVVLVALSLAFGLPLPLLPVQLLWLNLVTNGLQDVALAFEPRERDVLARHPRPPDERIFNRLMIERTLLGAVTMGLVGFAAFRWMLMSGWDEDAARNALLLLFVLFENVHIGNCRSETISLFRLSPLTSPWLLGATASAFLLHVGSMHWAPAQRVLRTQPLEEGSWLALIGLALTISVVMELHKALWAWRQRNAAAADS